jgi:hypothetical protein
MITFNQNNIYNPLFKKWSNKLSYFLTLIFVCLLPTAFYAQTCQINVPNPLPECGSTGNQLCATTTGTVTSYQWSVSGTGWAIDGGQGTSCITYTAGASGTTGNFTLVVSDGYYTSTCYVSFGCQAGGPKEGCTPGFWKNARSYWNRPTDAVSSCISSALDAPYNGSGTINSLYRFTFGVTSAQMTAVGLDPDITLLEAINSGGGGCFKLLRHSVAALLSSCGLTSYTYTTAQVLTMTHDAIVNQACEPTASELAAANEAGSCPLTADGNDDKNIPQQEASSLQSASAKQNEISVRAYPNPYFGEVNFSIVSPVSGKATLQLYDLIGRKLAVVFDGKVDAGASYTFKYKVPASNQVTLVYNFTVGNKTYHGIVVPRK